MIWFHCCRDLVTWSLPKCLTGTLWYNWYTVLKVRSVLSFAGDCHALHASRLFGKGPEVHRQGSNATRETKKFVPQLIPVLYKEKVLIINNYIMWNYACWILKKKTTFCSPCLYMFFIFYLSVSVLDCSPILSTFQVILLEHIIMCRLVTGHKATALQEVHCFCICAHYWSSGIFDMWQSWELHFVACHKNEIMLVDVNTDFCSVHSDLTGVSAVPTVPKAIHQPRCSASHSISEYFHLKYCVCLRVSRDTFANQDQITSNFLENGHRFK